MSASSPRRQVTFADADVVVFLPPRTPEEEIPEMERPQLMSPSDPPLHSPTSTSTVSTSDPYTPPSNFERDISIESQDIDIADSDSFRPTLSDATARPEAKTLHGVTLHPCLSTSNPVQWDMLLDPKTLPRPHALDQFGNDFMTHDGFADSISEIQLNCDILPWPIIIDIEQDGLNHRSPQIDDIFDSIYASLWKLAGAVDFNRQTTERRGQIQKAYRRRCRQFISEERDGLRRIDFLEGQTMFFGLSPGIREDEWNLHVGQEY